MTLLVEGRAGSMEEQCTHPQELYLLGGGRRSEGEGGNDVVRTLKLLPRPLALF